MSCAWVSPPADSLIYCRAFARRQELSGGMRFRFQNLSSGIEYTPPQLRFAQHRQLLHTCIFLPTERLARPSGDLGCFADSVVELAFNIDCQWIKVRSWKNRLMLNQSGLRIIFLPAMDLLSPAGTVLMNKTK
jgi:hypothetical protein